MVLSLFYLGIDIGKRNHEAGLISEEGNPIGKTVRFPNTKLGSEKILKFINRHELAPDNAVVGIEANGHYWLSVFFFSSQIRF